MSQTATKEKFQQDLKELIVDTEALIKETGGDLSEKARETRAKLSAKLEKAKSRFLEVEQVIVEKASEGAKQADRVIRDHPYESIGVAFGIGLLVGILINRK